jgi:enhancer of polycomb-like protein
MDADLITLAEKKAEYDKVLQADLEHKIANHRRWNLNHIDLTMDPLSPVKEQGTELKFRPAKTQYLMTPPASISSDSMDVDEEAHEPMDVDKPQAPPIFQFKAGGLTQDALPANQPAFRRRIGRLSRLWIDRRGLATPPQAESDYSDRWKYDSDSDDDEPPVYEVDPFDTRALRFRTQIPINPYVFRGRPNAGADAAGHGSQSQPNRGSGPATAAAAAAAAASASAPGPAPPPVPAAS